MSGEEIVAGTYALPTHRVSGNKLGMGEDRVSAKEIYRTHDLLPCMVITMKSSNIYAN
jgi:hypothetical protein